MELTKFPSRNDACYCNSGKKYKKCCITKEKSRLSPTVGIVSYNIKYVPLTLEESQNNFPVLTDEDNKILSELHFQFIKQPKTIEFENSDYFQKLNGLLIKYPNHPMILNHIGSGYQLIRQKDKLVKLVYKNYENNPDYLFAKIGMANIYLQDDFPEKAIGIFNGAFTLKHIYPNRSVFHVSEVRAFEHFMVSYYCALSNFNQAKIHLDTMKKVLDEDDYLLIETEEMLRHEEQRFSQKKKWFQISNPS